MLKAHKGIFVLSSKAKKELRKLYRSNNHYILEFEDTSRLPDKRHREQVILNFEMKHVNKYDETDNVRRFKNASKLAQFAEIAPLKVSSANSETTKRRKEGNRRLQVTIYFLVIQMIQVSSKGVPRNLVFRAYYEKKLDEGKPTKQVLIYICRRLINIIYGMLKHQTEYRMPQLESEEKSAQEQG